MRQFDEAVPSGTPIGWLVLLVALIVSIGAVWLLSELPILTAAYAGGLATLMALLLLLRDKASGGQADALAPPDWSVTLAAIDQPGALVAITDRANRLVCASGAFSARFGTEKAPPNLALSEDEASEALLRAAREAWRDGRSHASHLSLDKDDVRWEVEAQRAGRGEDHLVWRFRRESSEDLASDVGQLLAGPLGRMLDRAGVVAALTSPEGTVRAASPTFAERATGDSSATLAGREFADFLRLDERERIFFARSGREGEPFQLIHVSLNDLDDDWAAGPEDAPSLMLLIEAHAALADNAAIDTIPKLEALIGALPLGLAMTDRDGRFLFANPSFLRAIGRTDSGLPTFPSDLVVREDKSAISDAVRRFGKGGAASGDVAVRLASSPEEPVSLGLASVRGLGEPAVLLTLADSREETELKRQIAQATKMQAIGQLAGGVAHDFNNVLTAIIGYCDLMLLRHMPGDSDYDDIQQIRANSNRAASLTRQLLAFSRQQTLRPEVVQLPDVVSEVSQLLKRLLGEKIEFHVRHDRDLGPVRADPGQLEQVIVNLAVNARDAIASQGGSMGEGTGTLVMSTRKVSLKETRNHVADMPPGDYTALIVRDTGGGIPPAVMSKIFDPFFTTKEQGKGTGLGLSTVYGIIRQSGGYIYVENVEGGDGLGPGARFAIYLPVHHGASVGDGRRDDGDQAEPALEWSNGGRILLVEDEDMVRAVAERALVRAGFTVTARPDGEDGLAEIANGAAFDLIVSDVVMPGMDGPAMARAIRKIRPEIPILFMSGYAEETLRNEISIENMHFIAKPFSVEQISRKVGLVLQGNSTNS
ncbi:hybrid sensor histidine kinase/response regulator [Alteriqipengyuania lutimaris]|uniref:histidine kinase n=1 Tax=Alteriqipengyuania lutimaris TaxID=1538146 RepID=A0A395LGU3_9SPHN|nr:response regulator [Alteriqipengyuania lutimaris]MBB3035234.1 two-component system cell cycle sensor histidine kinase/response regulator CckA [Alteriqipengyuania lutimaris]RDS75835.1 response regulator [Alteriqipengyuania lutimaris]